MNKKFSTLVASVLLVGSLGANAQISLTVPSVSASDIVDVKAYDASLPKEGYQVGVSYLLDNGSQSYLSINDNGELALLSQTEVLRSLDKGRRALWTLQQIISPAGAVAPKYVFVNDATYQTLAVDADNAKDQSKRDEASSIKVGGTQTEWLSAVSYKDPTTPTPIYATLAGDSVIALATNNVGKVVLVKEAKAKLNAGGNGIISFKPYKFDEDKGYYLSAHDLNTMLGTTSTEATADSYFSFNFKPEATVKGEDNLWAQDLQAVAVDQYEIKWGLEADKDGSAVSGDFASLYPSRKTRYTGGSQKIETITKSEVNSFDYTTPQYYAFKNRDGEYIVVDTLTIDGTTQSNTNRMSFAMDGLFNAKDDTRFRNPKSYLFAVKYNPSTKSLQIETKGYYNARATAAAPSDFDKETYYTNYAAQAQKEASRWTNATPADATAADGFSIVKAALGSTVEVTVGTPTSNNKFTLALGSSSKYQMTHLTSGAYLIKIYASDDNPSNVGKYWVDNLKGTKEIMEEATRQNFQDMPAAQWIVSSTGSADGSLVTITNREFENTIYTSRVVYRETSYPGNTFTFGPGQDVLQLIPVEKPNDKYLGYKFVEDKDIDVTTFTFNYLHDLAMDKPINTKSDKDSVVWVDKDGNETKFTLVKYKDDTYGTTGGLPNVAELTRRVYKIKVNDASKLDNNGRFLAYDNSQKKYVVSSTGDLFFLKENNETDGNCYYALLQANTEKVTSLNLKVNDYGRVENSDETLELSNTDEYVRDNDLFGMFYTTDGQVVDPNTGVAGNGKVPAIDLVEANRIAGLKYVDGYEYIPVTKNQYLAIERQSALPTNIVLGSTPISLYATDGITVEVSYSDYLIDTNNGNKVLCLHRYVDDNKYYSDYKVSVDNNTLDLVNGVLSNSSYNEVATSAFAVAPVADPLYRRFNVEALGENADDAPNTLKFFRVNATDKEYLYEDAQSVYSKDKGFNFLGVEGKGDAKNAAIYVDTAYVDRGTKMPQYLLALRPNIVKGDTILCDATTHAHATEEEALACDHSKVTPSYVDAWYLVNLQDSIDYYSDAKHKDAALVAKYQWNRQYTRLGFVEARHIGDTLVIKNSVYTGNTQQINVGDSTTWASKDSIRLDNNKHKNVVFSFRIAKSGSNDFLIESETEKDGANVKNSKLTAAKIAPMKGGWVKIQNGVPVIANNLTYSEIGMDAEIFNVEATDEAPTANDAIATSEVSIVAVQGAVVVKNAAGKKVAISNILGQNIANAVLSSDNETIAAPAGIVVVAVEGEEAVKAVVK